MTAAEHTRDEPVSLLRTDIVERLRGRHAAWLRECKLEGKELPYEFRESLWSTAADEIERLRRASSPLDWQPMETAPKDGTRVLVKLDHPIWDPQIARWQYEEWRLDNNDWPCHPLRWQPLPGAPPHDRR